MTFDMMNVLQAVMGGSDRSCFSEEENQACEQPEKANLRGKVLKHVIVDHHLKALSNCLESKITKFQEDREFSQEVLDAKNLPSFYLVPKSENSSGYKFVKTDDYLKEEVEKKAVAEASIEKLESFRELYKSVFDNALAVHEGLTGLNEAEVTETDVTEFKEGAYAAFEKCKTELEEECDQLQKDYRKEKMMSMLNGDGGILELLFMDSAPSTPKARSIKNVIKVLNSALKEFTEYQNVFESCLKGIEATIEKVSE